MKVRGEGLGHDLLDADLHRVAGLGAVDEDGTGHRVRPAAGIGQPELDDVVHRRPGLDGVVRVHHRLHGHGVAGVDHELRLLVGVEPAPLGGLERGRQDVVRPAARGDRAVALGLVQRRELIGLLGDGVVSRADPERHDGRDGQQTLHDVVSFEKLVSDGGAPAPFRSLKGSIRRQGGAAPLVLPRSCGSGVSFRITVGVDAKPSASMAKSAGF